MEQQSNRYRLGDLQERYRLLAKLGAGGMADVFLGVQSGAENFRRMVVLKRIRSTWCEEEESVRMFVDEARLVASLNHPHIVKVFDLCWMGQDICLAMEYIDGESLGYLIGACKKQGLRIPLPVTFKLIVEAAEALHYAHSATDSSGAPLNLVHRDIGPQNLLLDGCGYLKVIDFGVAKSTAQTELTSPGLVKGKIPYMAPDLFQEHAIDGRVDLYALGLVFYEMLTLQQGFTFKRDSSLASVMHRITSEHLKPASEVVSDLDPTLDALIAKATHKDRDLRYSNGDAMASEFSKYAERYGGMATTAQVSEWFRENFGERIERRREFERLALQKAEQPPAGGEAISQTLSRTNELRSSSGNTGRRDTSQGQATTGAPSKRVHYGLVFAAMAGIATGVGAFYVYHQQNTTQTSQLQAALTQPPPVPKPMVNVLEVHSQPPGAEVFANGRSVGKATADGLTLRVDAERSHQLVVRLAGYEDHQVAVPRGPFGDRRIVASLTKVQEAIPSAAPAPAAPQLAMRTPTPPPSTATRKRPPPKRSAKPSKANGAAATAKPTEDTDEAPNSTPPGADPPDTAEENKPNAADIIPTAVTRALSSTSTAPSAQPAPTPIGPPVPAAPVILPTPPKPPAKPRAKVASGPRFMSMADALRRRVAGQAPSYPRLARNRGHETVVAVKVRINEKGRVEDTKFVRGDPLFQDEVLKALRGWRFRPLVVEGKPVETYTVLKFGFKLRQ